jgi:hypothetical protein
MVDSILYFLQHEISNTRTIHEYQQSHDNLHNFVIILPFTFRTLDLFVVYMPFIRFKSSASKL